MAVNQVFLIAGILIILSLIFITYRLKFRTKQGTTALVARDKLKMEDILSALNDESSEEKKQELIKTLEISEDDFEKLSQSLVTEKEVSDAAAIKKIPEAASLKNDQGVEAYKKGNLEESVILCREAVEIAPHYALAHYNLGNAYFQNQNYHKAIESFLNVVRYNPEDEFAHYNLAMSYYKSGDLNRATEYYQKALEISPGDPYTHYNLAKVFEKLNDLNNAINAYQKSLSLKSDYANAHYNLAELLKYKGRYKQAISEYELYLKYNPGAEDAFEVKKMIVDLRMK